MVDPVVSVIIMSYNHEKYVSQSIEGVLMQRTEFPFELVIGDDFSTDSTRKIIIGYAEKTPEIIRYIFSESNQGVHKNFTNSLSSCKGKYIALCEGDDYWTDPMKLQKQVEFLESNPDYGLVCTDIEVVNENGEIIIWQPLIELKERYKSGYIFFEQFKGATINTLTSCFRVQLIDEILYSEDLWYLIDLWLWLRISMKSKVKYMNFVSAH